MIQVNNLTKQYAGVKVLDIENFTINKGESFGLVGNNGAGKTTFFRLILDLIRASSGTVLINYEAVNKSISWALSVWLIE